MTHVRLPTLAASATAAVLAMGGLAACSPDADAGGGEGATVTVGTLRGQPHLYQPFFYEQFASDDDLEFEIVTFDSSPDIKNAVVSGAVDFGVTGVPSALTGISQGEDVKVIASAADGGSGFIGNDTIRSVDDLTGKNVGYPQGASQEILLRLTLEREGVDIDALNLVNLPFSDMASALASGSVDAFLSAELGPSTALQAGGREIVSPYDTPVGRVNIGLITTGELIESDPDRVQAVVDTHRAAIDHMLANTDEWAAGLVENFGLDEAVVSTAIENIWLRYDLSGEYQEQVVALADEMASIDILSAPPTVDQIFDTSFVD